MVVKRGLYSTGRFARRASVSVRTLRYYDRTGLLVPSERTEAGYRLYTDADLLRLQQVLALKFLGFSLDEIRRCLAAGPRRLQASLGQQKAMLREKRWQLDAILLAIEEAERHLEGEQSSFESVVQVIEVIQMQQKNDWVNKYFTPEQQEQMQRLTEGAYSEEARQKLAARDPWTGEDQQRADEQWGWVNGELKRLVAAGADPASAEAQEWARRFNELISAFTQNDPEVEAGLRNWWTQHNALPDAERPMGAPRESSAEQRFKEAALAAFREQQA